MIYNFEFHLGHFGFRFFLIFVNTLVLDFASAFIILFNND